MGIFGKRGLEKCSKVDFGGCSPLINRGENYFMVLLPEGLRKGARAPEEGLVELGRGLE